MRGSSRLAGLLFRGVADRELLHSLRAGEDCACVCLRGVAEAQPAGRASKTAARSYHTYREVVLQNGVLGRRTADWAGSQPSNPRWEPLLARLRSSAAEGSVKEAQQKLSAAVLGSKNAAKPSLAAGGGSLYHRLPAQVRQVLQSVTEPGNIQRVVKLQLEAFWGNHGRKVLAVGAALLVYGLWRTLFKVTSVFVNLSETMADFGFLALAAALASFGFLYLRRLYTINPDAVYRLAMLQLNTNPAVLEVMGAPVTGSNVRASVQTGGGLRLKGFRPRLRSRRVQMIFPLTGSERRGLVSLEAKKLKGRYLFKLLAVDVPTAAGPEQRLFIEGDERAYGQGGVIKELRDPFLHAVQLKEAHELEDEIDDAAEEARAAHAKRAKEAAKLSKAPKPLDEGGGMYFHERAYWAVRRFFMSPTPQPVSQEAAKSSSSELKSEAVKVASEKLDAGKLPKQPTEPEQQGHQFKKEASSQQAP